MRIETFAHLFAQSLTVGLGRHGRRSSGCRAARRGTSRRAAGRLEPSERLERRLVMTGAAGSDRFFLTISGPASPMGCDSLTRGAATSVVQTAPAAKAAARPVSPPAAPALVTGVPGNGKIDLKWRPPAANGGATVRDYVIQFSSDGGSTWTTFNDGTSAAAVAHCKGLVNGTAYVFRVAAANRAGPGEFSAVSASVTPRTIPGLPTGVTGGGADRQVSLSWTPPASDGGAAVTDYLVQFKTAKAATWKTFVDGVSAATSTTVTGLMNGTGYVFRVAARNASGTSGFSAVSPTVTPLPLLAAPSGVAATAAAGLARLTWQAPAAPVGQPITGYAVQFSGDGGASWSTFNGALPPTPATTVTGLVDGTSYVFRVAGRNASGTGVYSIASAPVTPAGQVAYQTKHVGNAGNLADTTGYGAVDHPFGIGTHEVTIAQYTAFLNAVAADDPFGLYVPEMATNLTVAGVSRSGVAGSYTYSVMNNGGDSSNRPITDVSWFNAARFANWMTNGQPSGPESNATTEDGAYALHGAVGHVPAVVRNAVNPNTGVAPTWFIPTEDEWYKAAFYSPDKGGPGVAGYYTYATQSDADPGNLVGGTPNQANVALPDGFHAQSVFAVTQQAFYDVNQNYLTDVGSFTASASFYGTFDQSGNAAEWTDLDLATSMRPVRGGGFYGPIPFRVSRLEVQQDVPWDDQMIGFRLATTA